VLPFSLLNILFQILTVHIHALKFSFSLKSIVQKNFTMYEMRKDLPFYLPLRVFKIFWFFDLDPNKSQWITSMGKISLLVFLFILDVILPLCHLIKIAIVYDDISNCEDIAALIGSFGFCIACYNTMYNHQHFNKVLRDLTDTTRFGKPTTFDAEMKKCHLLSIILLIYMNVGVTVYGLLSRIETRHGPCMRHQAETSEDLYCTAIYPIWVPFKINKALLFLIQLSTAMEIYNPSGQLCGMLYEEVALLTSHMDFFSSRLKNVFREEKTKKGSQMLEYCAKYHCHIISLGLQVDELHRKVTGHMALFWAVSMGCIANQLFSLVNMASINIQV
ncbi:unnamed protein product, partial [Callosobruchus maculatus]